MVWIGNEYFIEEVRFHSFNKYFLSAYSMSGAKVSHSSWSHGAYSLAGNSGRSLCCYVRDKRGKESNKKTQRELPKRNDTLLKFKNKKALTKWSRRGKDIAGWGYSMCRGPVTSRSLAVLRNWKEVLWLVYRAKRQDDAWEEVRTRHTEFCESC